MAFFNTDIPELSGSDTAICLANMELLGLRQSRVTESMLASLSELANAVIRDAGGDPDTVTSILLSLQGDEDASAAIPEAILESIPPVNRDMVARLSLYTDVQMRLILYRFIADRLPANNEATEPSAVADASRGRIAYMAGAFADKAYERLSPLVPHARAATFPGFVDACEEVCGGLCEYAILPLENTQSGKLTAFARLILRYGLYVVAVCDLENGVAPGQFTRFALLCKSPEEAIPAPHALSAIGSEPVRYLDLLHTTDTPSAAQLLSAAAFCGLSLERMDTLPRFEELDFPDDKTLPLCCVFHASDPARADLPTFLCYLALESPDDRVTGAYRLV